MSQFEIAVMNNQAKRPYSNASTSQYSIGFLARSTLDLFMTAVPVTVPYMARDNGISERAKHKNGWFRMLSCPMPAMLSRAGLKGKAKWPTSQRLALFQFEWCRHAAIAWEAGTSVPTKSFIGQGVSTPEASGAKARNSMHTELPS